MSKPQKSLISAERAQLISAPLLFSEEEMGLEYIGDPAESGIFTGDRLFRDRPEVYREIVRLSAEGQSMRSIARLCKVHHRTVAAVREREGESIDTLKKEIGRRCFDVSRLTLESIEEAVVDKKIKPEALAVTFGIVAEKGQLLTGGATVRVDQVKPPEENAFTAWMEEQRREKLANATVVQPSGIGLGAETVGQMSPALGAPSPAPLAPLPLVVAGSVNTPVGRAAGDGESPVSGSSPLGDGAGPTSLPTGCPSESAENPAHPAPGEGGVEKSTGGVKTGLD